MRPLRLLFLLLCFAWIFPLQAQNDSMSYNTALRLIEEARISGTTELNLFRFELTELPSEIGQLHNLQSLNLGSNQLRNLPPEIGQLTNLQYLSLANNQLSSLPPEIGQLINLRWFNLSDNQLVSLPTEIGQLADLCHFELWGNGLTHLPNSLGNLTNLTGFNCDLTLNGNPLITPPQEVIAQGTPAILDYLRNQAWWHLQHIIIYAASVIGFLALAVLGLRWRNRRIYSKKKKREQ